MKEIKMKVNKVFVASLAILLAVGVQAATGVTGVTGATGSSESKPKTVVLTKSNTMILNSEIDGESTAKVISKARELDGDLSSITGKLTLQSGKPLYLFLNTPGGSIQSGLELIEALKGIGRPIHTITLFAASMGFQIAENLDDRLIIKNGVLMSHRAYGQFEGSFGGESPSQIDNRYALWKDRMDELDTQTVLKSKGKQTMESYQKQYSHEMWLTGTKSVAQGYADRVVQVKCDKSLAGTTQHEVTILGMFRVTYELDNCPINTSPMNIAVGIVTTRGYMNSEEFIKNGGQFGPSCLMDNENKDKLCALDTSLNFEKVRELKNTFQAQYELKAKTVVPYRW
jgi:ATP-dependent Clp protease protease subunit